jgi:Zn-dependent peptidase ImmA (M78 family)
VPGLHTNIGAKRAREARAALGLDDAAPLPCVVTAVERLGGVPVIVAAMPDGCAGACVRTRGGPVIWVNGCQAVVRRRFTVAHEFGHVRCGHDGATAVVDTDATLEDEGDACEVEANAFAAEFLAPRAGVRALAGDREPGLEDVVRIALTYGLSSQAALFRLRTLRLAGHARCRALQQELADGLEHHVRDRVAHGVEPIDDVLGAISSLPRIPPALEGSALAAALRGEVSVEAAARAADASPAALGAAIAHLGG